MIYENRDRADDPCLLEEAGIGADWEEVAA